MKKILIMINTSQLKSILFILSSKRFFKFKTLIIFRIMKLLLIAYNQIVFLISIINNHKVNKNIYILEYKNQLNLKIEFDAVNN